MANLPDDRVRIYVNPQITRAAEQVDVLLADYRYDPAARGVIWRHIATTGRVTDAPGLDPEDRADAERVFIESLEPVDYGSDAWGRDLSVYLDVDSLVERGRADVDRPKPNGDEPLDPPASGELPAGMRAVLGARHVPGAGRE
jgi:hypothetical protein